jgi:hypothetical protein
MKREKTENKEQEFQDAEKKQKNQNLPGWPRACAGGISAAC